MLYQIWYYVCRLWKDVLYCTYTLVRYHYHDEESYSVGKQGERGEAKLSTRQTRLETWWREMKEIEKSETRERGGEEPSTSRYMSKLHTDSTSAAQHKTQGKRKADRWKIDCERRREEHKTLPRFPSPKSLNYYWLLFYYFNNVHIYGPIRNKSLWFGMCT